MTDTVRDAIAAGLATLTRLVRTPDPPLNRGVDMVCVNDLDPRGVETDPNATDGLAQDLYHRLCTDRGELPDDADYGADLRRYLSRPTDATSLQQMSHEIGRELEKDDRVASTEVEVTATDPKTLQVRIIVEPEAVELSEFIMIVTVTDGATHLEVISS